MVVKVMVHLWGVVVVAVEQLLWGRVHQITVLTILLEEQELQVLLLDHLLQDQREEMVEQMRVVKQIMEPLIQEMVDRAEMIVALMLMVEVVALVW